MQALTDDCVDPTLPRMRRKSKLQTQTNSNGNHIHSDPHQEDNVERSDKNLLPGSSSSEAVDGGGIKRTASYFAFAFAPSVHPHTSMNNQGSTTHPPTTTPAKSKDLTIEEKKLLYRKAWLLTISSAFFLIPACFAYYHAIYSMSLLSTFTTMVSVAFWYRPRDGIRRMLDLVVAKLSFVIYFTVGLFNIRESTIFGLGLVGAVLMIGSYGTGLTLFDARSPRWVYAHMVFHFLVACGQVLVLYGSFLL